MNHLKHASLRLLNVYSASQCCMLGWSTVNQIQTRPFLRDHREASGFPWPCFTAAGRSQPKQTNQLCRRHRSDCEVEVQCAANMLTRSISVLVQSPCFLVKCGTVPDQSHCSRHCLNCLFFFKKRDKVKKFFNGKVNTPELAEG